MNRRLASHHDDGLDHHHECTIAIIDAERCRACTHRRRPTSSLRCRGRRHGGWGSPAHTLIFVVTKSTGRMSERLGPVHTQNVSVAGCDDPAHYSEDTVCAQFMRPDSSVHTPAARTSNRYYHASASHLQLRVGLRHPVGDLVAGGEVPRRDLDGADVAGDAACRTTMMTRKI